MRDVPYVGCLTLLMNRACGFMSTSTESAPSPALIKYFTDLEGSRRENSTDYSLHEIALLAICAVICWANGFTSIASLGQAKMDWLGQFLDLENSISSRDTIGRLFSLLVLKGFEVCFFKWVDAGYEQLGGEIVAVDRKTLRHSRPLIQQGCPAHDRTRASENGLVPFQVRIEDKSNEITATPELLEVLNVSGCIVSIDARVEGHACGTGCQKAIPEVITGEGADDVLALKGNQGELRANTETPVDRIGEGETQDVHTGVTVGSRRGAAEPLRSRTRGSVDREGWYDSTVCMIGYGRLKGGERATCGVLRSTSSNRKIASSVEWKEQTPRAAGIKSTSE